MKNKSGRIYVGDVLDILKKVSNRYASITESTDGKGVTNLSLTVYLECNASAIEVCFTILSLYPQSAHISFEGGRL